MRKSRPMTVAVDENSLSDNADYESGDEEVLAVPEKRKRGRPANPDGPKKPVIKKPLVPRGRGRPLKAKGRGRPKTKVESGDDERAAKDPASKKGDQKKAIKLSPSKGQPRKHKD